MMSDATRLRASVGYVLRLIGALPVGGRPLGRLELAPVETGVTGIGGVILVTGAFIVTGSGVFSVTGRVYLT
jgi:hypothetical protein